MPAWMEKIKDTFTAKADLKSLFIVLQPDNQVSTVMVVSYVPTDKDSFQVFMDLTARIAMDQKTIPDNLLLHFEGIPAKDIPFTSELPAKDSEKALSFIASYGGITENNSVPLRKAAYLRACQRELTAENIRDLDYSPAYKCFIAHEDAMEKIAAGKQAKQFYTIAETEQGVRVFNDGLSGTKVSGLPAIDSGQFLLKLFAGCGVIEYLPDRNRLPPDAGTLQRESDHHAAGRDGNSGELQAVRHFRHASYGRKSQPVCHSRRIGTLYP